MKEDPRFTLRLLDAFLSLQAQPGYKDLLDAIREYQQKTVRGVMSLTEVSAQVLGRAQGINDTCQWLLGLNQDARKRREGLAEEIKHLEQLEAAAESGHVAFGMDLREESLLQFVLPPEGR